MSNLLKRLEAAALKAIPPDGHELDFLSVEDMLEGEAILEITRLRAQRDKLLPLVRKIALIELDRDVYQHGLDELRSATALFLTFSASDVRDARSIIAEAEKEP